MKKISLIKQTIGILSASQMLTIRGGTASESGNIGNLDLRNEAANGGSSSIVEGEKRPERPGGGISTH